jgi:signal transduction histidine kinase
MKLIAQMGFLLLTGSLLCGCSTSAARHAASKSTTNEQSGFASEAGDQMRPRADLCCLMNTIDALKQIHTDSYETNIPPEAKPRLTALKHELLNLIVEILASEDGNVSAQEIEARAIVDLRHSGIAIKEQGCVLVDANYFDPGYDYGRIHGITVTRPNQCVNLIAVTLWCGTNNGFFARDKDTIWHEVQELNGRVIHSIAEDSQGRLLVGTATGLFVATRPSSRRHGAGRSAAGPEFLRVENPNGTTDNIRAITAVRGVTHIANFGRGVERLDGSRRTPVWPDDSAGARERQVVSLHADNERLWIGTAEAGVFLFDGKQSTVDNALDELIGAAVRSIEGASDGALWLASARGLYALKSGRLLRVIEGVDARCVVAASGSASENAVWCATVGGGLYKVLLDDDAGVPGSAAGSFLTSRIGSEQGLPSQNAFAVVPVRSGSGDEVLWIGTGRGVARYDPGHEAPVLNVTRVMGKRVYSAEELSSGLNLEYPQNSLSLDVAAISSRTFPEQFQYSFSVLDDVGRVVSEKRSRESQMLIEGLRPGRYRVVARAFAKDLVRSEALQFSFAVARAPFPWTSTGLSVLLTFALIAMWWGYRQNRRLSGTNRQLADTRMQLANETEAERRRIARDLHDQTLADLRRLIMLTDQLPPPNGSRNGHVEPSAFRDEIESISTEIRRICEDLSPSALANVGLAAALEWALADAVAHQPPEKKFAYEFVCDCGIEENLELTPADQIQIFRIMQEAVSNICRHSAATSVKLAVAIDVSGELLIKVEDNGCGFDSNKLAKMGRGLTNIRSRASLIDAEVAWETPSERGDTLFAAQTSVEGSGTNCGDIVKIRSFSEFG